MKRHSNRSVIVATTVVATVFPVLGASAQNTMNESSLKSLSMTGVVGLPLNPTAEIARQGEVIVQGTYQDLGKVPNTVEDEPKRNDDSTAKLSALATPEPGFSFDKNIGDFKYYGLFAAAGVGERLEISGGVARLQANGGLLYSLFNPFDGSEELFTAKSLETPDFGSGQFATIDYPGLKKTGFALSGKYLVKPARDANDVAVAAGAGFNTALADNVHAYVVASKNLTQGRRAIKGHIGARYDRFKLQARITETSFFFGESESNSTKFSETSNKFSAFVGAEVPLADGLAVVGELQSKNTSFGDDLFGEGKTPYSLSLRYAKDKVNASIGVQRQGILNDSGLFAQLGFAF